MNVVHVLMTSVDFWAGIWTRAYCGNLVHALIMVAATRTPADELPTARFDRTSWPSTNKLINIACRFGTLVYQLGSIGCPNPRISPEPPPTVSD